MPDRLIETPSQKASDDSGPVQSGLSRQPEAGTAPDELPPLSLPVRIGLHAVGWTLVLVGVAGLVIPGIQGILTGALGLALVSVASENVHRWLRSSLRRWPRLWAQVDKLHQRIHRRLRSRR